MNLRHFRRKLVTPYATAALRRAFPSHEYRPEATDRLAYFPRLGLCYNRIKKNGNTSVVLVLAGLEGRRTDTRAQTKSELLRLSDLRLSELQTLNRYHYFVVIRDPYSRVLSAFLEKFRLPEYVSRHRHFELSPAGFAEFLQWLDNGALERDPHWDLQTKLMIWPIQSYGTVIRLEKFAAGFADLLHARGLQVDEAALKDVLPQDISKKTGATDKVAAFYTDPGRDIVQRLYATDFSALGYPT